MSAWRIQLTLAKVIGRGEVPFVNDGISKGCELRNVGINSGALCDGSRSSICATEGAYGGRDRAAATQNVPCGHWGDYGAR